MSVTSRWRGLCHLCDGYFGEGQQITKWGKQWVHPDCATYRRKTGKSPKAGTKKVRWK